MMITTLERRYSLDEYRAIEAKLISYVEKGNRKRICVIYSA